MKRPAVVPWSEHEDETLKVAFRAGGTAQALRALPHRTRPMIIWRYRKLGLVVHSRWTEEDDADLARLAKEGATMAEAARALGKTARSIQNRAGRLGLGPLRRRARAVASPVVPPRPVKRAQCRPWEEWEDDLLKEIYSSTPLAEIAQDLKRTYASVAQRASFLGITADRSTAAKRSRPKRR